MSQAFYEERAAEKHHSRDNPEMRALVRRIGRWCVLQPGAKVVDLGCFDGYILRGLRRRYGILGLGLDISPAAVTSASADAEPGLAFAVSDGTVVPVDTASQDAVVCSEILEHVIDLDAVLDEMARVLRPGGLMYATMPNALTDVIAPLRPLCRRVDALEGHLRRMTREDFLGTLTRHRLEPVRWRYSGFLASGAWYRSVVYNPRLKSRALALVDSQESMTSRVAGIAAASAVHAYMAADAPFMRYRRCMGVLVSARRM